MKINKSNLTFFSVKSNSVLIPDSQLAMERAFVTSNGTIKEGLSSDEDDFGQKQTIEFDSSITRRNDILEDNFISRLSSYGNFSTSSVISIPTMTTITTTANSNDNTLAAITTEKANILNKRPINVALEPDTTNSSFITGHTSTSYPQSSNNNQIDKSFINISKLENNVFISLVDHKVNDLRIYIIYLITDAHSHGKNATNIKRITSEIDC